MLPGNLNLGSELPVNSGALYAEAFWIMVTCLLLFLLACHHCFGAFLEFSPCSFQASTGTTRLKGTDLFQETSSFVL